MAKAAVDVSSHEVFILLDATINQRTVLFAVAAVVLLGIPTFTPGQENTQTATKKLSAIKEKIRPGSKVVLLMDGGNQLSSRIAEDAIAIHLENRGATVFSREEQEHALVELLAKNADAGRASTASSFDLGAHLEADYVLTGTLLVDVSANQVISVYAVSVQVLDVHKRISIARLVIESPLGLSLAGLKDQVIIPLIAQ